MRRMDDLGDIREATQYAKLGDTTLGNHDALLNELLLRYILGIRRSLPS